jgi:tRNA A-37 threonylcarbamoyl transferase component Bud32
MSRSQSATDWARLLEEVAGLGRTELLDRLRAHLHRCWRDGRPLRAEEYREHLPQLQCDDGLFLDLLWSEVLLREELGEGPDRAEYEQRFPRFAAELRHRFALRQAPTLAAADAPAACRGTLASAEAGQTPQALPTTWERPVPASKAGAEGVQVPGYEIVKVLGRGGMGVVYQARHLKLNRVVALKMILAGDHAGEHDLARFLAEAEAVAALQHPHIVQLYEYGQHNGLPFFTLEFVGGGNLADRLAGKPLPPREAARLVEQLARGVQAAHGRGIVHRDLKPANVLLTPDGTPKITDFGLAKKLNVGSGLTAPGAVMGTPSYMAPEQAAGRTEAIGPACDVHALGAILYECLTGRPPFQAATLPETLLQVLRAEPRSVRQFQPGVPRDLETICHKCLQKEPARRYANALDLAEDLRRFQAGEPIAARPVGLGERAWRWCRRNPVVVGLTGLLLAVTAVLVVVAFLGNRPAAVIREPARGERIRVGEPGAWKGAVAAAALDGRVYTVEKDRLYETDPGTGKRRPQGGDVFAGTRQLLPGDGRLYAVGSDGNLAAVNPADGGRRVVGPAPDWENTAAGVFLDGALYTTEDSKLWETNLADGGRKPLGKPEFADTHFLFAAGDMLSSIGLDGTLSSINPADGSRMPVGPPGEWIDTVAAAVLKGRLYTAANGGSLYETDLGRGRWRLVGNQDLPSVRFLFAAGNGLYCIGGEVGSLYSINPDDGRWKPVGALGGWGNTVAAATLKGRLYTVEKSGVLYETDLSSGEWKAVGKPEFAGTSLLFAAGDALYSIEVDGSLYAINPGDGTWKRLGRQGAWGKTVAGTVWKDRLYTADGERLLVRTNPADGRRAVVNGLGRSLVRTDFLLAAGGRLYAIGFDGRVYEMNPAGGAAKAIGQLGDLRGVRAAAVVEDRLYTVESDDNLHETDLKDGKRKQLGETEFGSTRFLLACGADLYALDGDGNLYRVHRK